MKNLRLFSLFAGCFLFTLTAFSQSFNSFGTYSGTTSNGKSIVIELDANGIASMMIDGVDENVIEFKYIPSNSAVIKFSASPNVVMPGETIPNNKVRQGLFESISQNQWRLQLNGFDLPAPAQFDGSEIILDFVPN